MNCGLYYRGSQLDSRPINLLHFIGVDQSLLTLKLTDSPTLKDSQTRPRDNPVGRTLEWKTEVPFRVSPVPSSTKSTSDIGFYLCELVRFL